MMQKRKTCDKHLCKTSLRKLKKLYPKSLQSIDDAKSRKIWNIHAGVEICAYMSWCIIRPPLVLTCCSKGKAPPDTRFANCVKICLQPWSVAWAEGKKIGGLQIGAHFISNPALQRAVAAYIQPHTKLPGFTSVASKYHSQPWTAKIATCIKKESSGCFYLLKTNTKC